ncbi:DUF1642 domain-containing protein [Vibrio parahaemolyticus]|nr:DUF1642 domain-containing protein [Vibrio parahaemolyticus]
MNKQELIEKIAKAIKDELSGNYYREFDNYGHIEYEHYTEEDAQSVANDIILDLEEGLEPLDVPQKQVMPKFFDDWAKQVIKQRDKFYAISLITRAGWDFGVDYELDENRSPSTTRELLSWLVKDSLYLNKEKAVNALLYGYEVEKEPLYIMPVPHVSFPVHYFVEDDHISFRQGNAQKFTQAELDRYFPDIKQFAVEVEAE